MKKWGGYTPHQWRMNLFHNFLAHTELRDLHFQGPCFTWYRLRNNQVDLKERLDHCLGNAAWCSAFPHSQVFNLPIVGSDHRPILFDSTPKESPHPSSFVLSIFGLQLPLVKRLFLKFGVMLQAWMLCQLG